MPLSTVKNVLIITKKVLNLAFSVLGYLIGMYLARAIKLAT